MISFFQSWPVLHEHRWGKERRLTGTDRKLCILGYFNSLCCLVFVLLGCFLLIAINQSFTFYFKASPCWSGVHLSTSLNEHTSLWCHQWHSDDRGPPLWHVGHSPAMTSPRQTRCQTEHWCSSHYSSCRDRKGVVGWRQLSDRLLNHDKINVVLSQIDVPGNVTAFYCSFAHKLH